MITYNVMAIKQLPEAQQPNHYRRAIKPIGIG
jgi:hypothetical protein